MSFNFLAFALIWKGIRVSGFAPLAWFGVRHIYLSTEFLNLLPSINLKPFDGQKIEWYIDKQKYKYVYCSIGYSNIKPNQGK